VKCIHQTWLRVQGVLAGGNRGSGVEKRAGHPYRVGAHLKVKGAKEGWEG